MSDPLQWNHIPTHFIPQIFAGLCRGHASITKCPKPTNNLLNGKELPPNIKHQQSQRDLKPTGVGIFSLCFQQGKYFSRRAYTERGTNSLNFSLLSN